MQTLLYPTMKCHPETLKRGVVLNNLDQQAASTLLLFFFSMINIHLYNTKNLICIMYLQNKYENQTCVCTCTQLTKTVLSCIPVTRMYHYALLSTCIWSDNNHRVSLINDRRNPEIWTVNSQIKDKMHQIKGFAILIESTCDIHNKATNFHFILINMVSQ